MKIALGTAQFGLDYGITNAGGQVAFDVVGDLLSMSAAEGIHILDTAIAYGESEKVLGKFDLSKFDVVSKVPSLKKGGTRTMSELAHESLENLGIEKLYGLLMHDENDVNHEHLDSLHELKQQGITDKIGASFYSPEKAILAIETGMMDLIQIPANQLDSRFEDAGVYQIAQRHGVEVHVRSIFLQGLLAVDDSLRPERFKNHPDLVRFDDCAIEVGLSPLELALDYVSKKPCVGLGVIGCTSCSQLEQIISAYRQTEKLVTDSLPLLASDDDVLLNPSRW